MIYSGRINSFMHCIYKPGYMIVNNVLGRDYIFVNRFNSCNHISFHLQVVHDGVESCCDIVQVQTRRLPSCQLEIPAIKVKTVALIGPDKFLANIFALFLRPNSFLLQSR